ncbi:MAG: ECF transporter S component [Aeriscardovia sp.]|nr:ECF transporter S component [Aeriscardovia sp.]MBR3359304.1 ECF transporter S component [Aeriscardovia sp.]
MTEKLQHHDQILVRKKTHRNLRWRPVDIAVASVIGVASSIVFWAADFIPHAGLQALFPGLGSLIDGIWLFAGVLTGIIIRKPGAAVYAQILASLCESLMGNLYGGALTVLSGLIQGMGAELIFAICTYRIWNVWITMLAGAMSGFFYRVVSFATDMQAFNALGWYALSYFIATIISGIVIAGILTWLVYRSIARTGALDRFESGRVVRMKVSQ